MRALSFAVGSLAVLASAQDYAEYADGYVEDNLYQDYAIQHQEGGRVGGFGIGQVALVSGFTYFLGAKIHSGRVAKKLKQKHQKDQKTLYTQ